MKELDIKGLIKSIWTAEAGPNPHRHTLLCLLSAHKLSSEKNGQMTKLSPKQSLQKVTNYSRAAATYCRRYFSGEVPNQR